MAKRGRKPGRRKSELAKKIIHAYENKEFIGAIIYGEQGVGKSQYAMKVGYDVFEDWDEVLYHMAFTIQQVLNLLEGIRKKMIIWDDAGVHASKYLTFTDTNYVYYLTNVLDVVRTRAAALILTTPSVDKLLKQIRGQTDWYVIKIRKERGNRRIARIYRQYTLPTGLKFVRLQWQEYFTINNIPQHVLKRYYPMREKYAKYTLNQLQRFLEKKKEKVIL